MPTGPNASIDTMTESVAYTAGALATAADIDPKRTEEDRVFFAEQAAGLGVIAAGLREVESAYRGFLLGPGLTNQFKVTFADRILDSMVRDARARTRLELKTTTGLGVEHVFGRDSKDLVQTPIRLEPAAVIDAANRMDDVDDFPRKEEIKNELITFATKQEELLAQRDAGWSERDRLRSAVIIKTTEAANALARIQGALWARFPRQRSYVSSFFLSARRNKRAQGETTSTETP